MVRAGNKNLPPHNSTFEVKPDPSKPEPKAVKAVKGGKGVKGDGHWASFLTAFKGRPVSFFRRGKVQFRLLGPSFDTLARAIFFSIDAYAYA